MKRFISTLIVLALVMGMSITATAKTAEMTEMEIDLQGVSVTATHEDDNVLEYAIYATGDIQYFIAGEDDPIFELLYLALNDPKYDSMEDPVLIGYYNVNLESVFLGEFYTVDYTITPDIKGFDDNTDYDLLSRNDFHTNWASCETTVSGNSIVTTIDSNAYDSFALVVDRATLSDEGTAPGSNGLNVHFEGLDAVDGNGTDQKAVAAMFRFEDTGLLKLPFESLFEDDLFYDMIKAKDSSVLKENLVLLDKMMISPWDRMNPTFPYDVTFKYEGINSDTKIFIFHYDSEAEPQWEILEVTPGDEEFIGHFESMSPAVIYVDSSTLTPETPESPVTGDNGINYILFAGLIATIGLAGILRIRETE